MLIFVVQEIYGKYRMVATSLLICSELEGKRFEGNDLLTELLLQLRNNIQLDVVAWGSDHGEHRMSASARTERRRATLEISYQGDSERSVVVVLDSSHLLE